jgi:crotonobetainyl-CoA:carnitine CoA-transferase CaiB-like acyl-CoA transferase
MPALQGTRIIELAEGVGGEYCARLLADFGADVIKIERPGTGSPTRAMAPILNTPDALEASGLFAYLNTNKKSLTLDLASPTDMSSLHALIATADVVIDDHDSDWLGQIGLSRDDAKRNYPALVLCSITGFGYDAAPELNAVNSLNVMHASGWGYHTPSPPDRNRPPLKGPGRFLADYDAGIEAAFCVLASLYHRNRTGEGEFIDISTQAVLVSRGDTVVGRMLAGELEPRVDRAAFDHRGPPASFRCANGFVYIFITSRAHWAGVRTLMGDPPWLAEFAPNWLENVTDELIATFRTGFAAWVAAKDRETVCTQAQQLGVPLVPVNDAADLKRSEQFNFRGFFQRLQHPVLGEADYPTVPYLLSATPARLTSPAPRLGQDNGLIAARAAPERPAQPRAQLVPVSAPRGGPLQGLRVLEITKVWAGPYAGKMLAMLGAEVIKIESHRNMDEMRVFFGTDPDRAPHYLCLNPEILSVQLNLKSGEGVHYLRELIARSDIVINNIKPGAMERAGLGYEALREIKPDIISVSLKMNGNAGPLAYQTGYAPCFAALGGMSYLVGFEGEPPRAMNISYGDSTAGAFAALGTLFALMNREQCGEGQFVDVSAVESMASLVGDALFEYSLTGRIPGPDGNRHADMAPHGCYPCQGGEWISIAIATDAQWRDLCRVLKADDLLKDTRFGTMAARQANLAVLDAELSARTGPHYAAMLAAQLRQVGVPCYKSQNALDLISDDQLWRRGLFTTVTGADGALRPIVGAGWNLSRNPASVARGAPNLGEHNQLVLGGLLGIPPEKLQELIAKGIVD